MSKGFPQKSQRERKNTQYPALNCIIFSWKLVFLKTDHKTQNEPIAQLLEVPLPIWEIQVWVPSSISISAYIQREIATGGEAWSAQVQHGKWSLTSLTWIKQTHEIGLEPFRGLCNGLCDSGPDDNSIHRSKTAFQNTFSSKLMCYKLRSHTGTLGIRSEIMLNPLPHPSKLLNPPRTTYFVQCKDPEDYLQPRHAAVFIKLPLPVHIHAPFFLF